MVSSDGLMAAARSFAVLMGGTVVRSHAVYPSVHPACNVGHPPRTDTVSTPRTEFSLEKTSRRRFFGFFWAN